MVPQADPDDSWLSPGEGALGRFSPLFGMAAALAVWGAFYATVVTPSSLSRFERNAVLLACGAAVLAAGLGVFLYRPDRLSGSDRLMSVFGTNDLDVADLDAIRPAVGASALRTGRLPLGDSTTVERYLGRFERETSHDETHDERIRQFDALLDRSEGRV